MKGFRFIHPVEVRYGDLDPQWHVNNTRFLNYLEDARLAYFLNLGLWDGQSFLQLGTILADTHIAYLSPVVYGEKICVYARVAKIGNKSLKFEYVIEEMENNQIKARAETIHVAYDYVNKTSRQVPDAWRDIINTYEEGNNDDATRNQY